MNVSINNLHEYHSFFGQSEKIFIILWTISGKEIILQRVHNFPIFDKFVEAFYKLFFLYIEKT